MMHVYRRPHDHRAIRHDQRLVYGSLYADVPVSVYRIPSKLIVSGGVYRQSYTVVPSTLFIPPTPQGVGGTSSISFTCSATAQSVFDSASGLILYFSKSRKERAAWSRAAESWDAIRALVPQFTSWQPTAQAQLTFAVTGTAIGALFGAGATTLSFSATAVINSTGVLRGLSTLTFSATAITAGETLISGATSLSFAAIGVLSSGLIGSTSLSFTAVANSAGLSAMQGHASMSFVVGNAPIIIYTPADVLVRATRRGFFAGRERDAGATFYITTPYEYSPYWMVIMTGLPDDWIPLMRTLNGAVNRDILRPVTSADVTTWLATGNEPPTF